jgi:ribosomal protein L9
MEIKVIMKQNVQALMTGEIKTVSRGYAEFLVRKNLAQFHTVSAEKELQTKLVEMSKYRSEQKEKNKIIVDKLKEARIRIIENISESGQFYGSISAKVIAEKLNTFLGEERLNASDILMDKPIKEPKIYIVKVRVGEEKTTVLINASNSEKKANEEEQKYTNQMIGEKK